MGTENKLDKGVLLMCLHEADFNRDKAAAMAGVSRATFYRGMKAHKVKAPHPFKVEGGFVAYMEKHHPDFREKKRGKNKLYIKTTQPLTPLNWQPCHKPANLKA